MSSIYYLYKKTHNKTGLKYLGQTTRDPFTYRGSGTYWQRHIKKHGYDVTTELISTFNTLDDLKVAGLFWSNHYNIVESNEWANLVNECGDGGFSGQRPWNKGKSCSKETKEKMSESHKGQIAWNKGQTGVYSEKIKEKLRLAKLGKHHTEEHKQKIREANLGKHHTEETKKKIGLANKGRIPWSKGKTWKKTTSS